ncbi:hypothetical protein LIER_08717 [Lithospermum erythrorhizon]|uniref:Uncharacterized protein n=1 Tax=Lithospermum erythrorhizon TaxID=34254 RepID=A0AAV3PHT2_LITER
MSDSTNSHLKGQGYNSDARSSSSPQVSSSIEAWARSGSSVPLQATLLASRAPSSSRLPPQAKSVRADIHQCGSELSERDLVDMRSRYDIPSSVVLRHPKPTDRANTPPLKLRNFFVVALDNGLRLPVHPYIGEHTQNDGFLYFTVRTEMKGFCEAFLSKVGPETWGPFFFYALVPRVPSFSSEVPRVYSFLSPQKSYRSPGRHPGTLRHGGQYISGFREKSLISLSFFSFGPKPESSARSQLSPG